MVPNPLALIAEVTHRCPLHCPYCSNPMQLAAVDSELSTAEWSSVFQQSGKLGMLHAHFTGGEPLARTDLTELIAAARAAGLYTNLITSGIGLTEQRLAALVAAGLDHIQISFQDSREAAANWIAGAKAHSHKIELSRAIRQHKIAFTVNLVVHRQNLDHLEEIRRTHPHRLGRARLLRKISQGLHGRLGAKINAHQSRRQSASLPRGGGSSGDVIRKCARKNTRVDLAGVFFVSEIPRRRLDARALPQLRSPQRRFRGLPLSGFSAYRRRYRHRSRLLTRSGTWNRRSGRPRRQFRSGRCAARDRIVVRATSETDHRPLDIPHEPGIIGRARSGMRNSMVAFCIFLH